MRVISAAFRALCVLSLLILVVIQPAWSATQSEAKPITIGFIPSEDPATLRENGVEFAKLLQARLGVPVNIYISKDYSGLIEAMKEKKVDFAFFSTMTFVFAEKMAGAKVLLKRVWEGPYYYSMILTRADAKITDIKKMKGKKFAFVDQKSASGFLYPSAYFKKQGVEPGQFFGEVVYSGNHEESVRLLRDKKVDGIAVFANDPAGKSSAWVQYAKKGLSEGAKLPAVHTLWASAPIPNDPFCVRQDFYDSNPRLTHDLMFAMIELDSDVKEGGRFRKLLGGMKSLMLATSQQYEPVREMVQEMSISLQ